MNLFLFVFFQIAPENILSDGKEPPKFTSDELNAIIDRVWSENLRRIHTREDIGTIQWLLEKESNGYTVEKHVFENVREYIESLDLSTGRVEEILSDPMDVYIYILKREGRIERFYLIREIHHRYKTGEFSTTRIVEAYER